MEKTMKQMTTWNYRVIKDNAGNFYVAEVYYDWDGEICNWSDYLPDILHWDNYDDLKGTAEQVIRAFDHPVLTFEGMKLVEA